MKFRPPRFSVRTRAIVVTLVCAYFGAWEATKKWGVPPPAQTISSSSVWPAVIVHGNSPCPFIVRKYVVQGEGRTEYHFWFFGLEVKLPYDSPWDSWNYMMSGEWDRDLKEAGRQ
jgi:hypothetical protein